MRQILAALLVLILSAVGADAQGIGCPSIGGAPVNTLNNGCLFGTTTNYGTLTGGTFAPNKLTVGGTATFNGNATFNANATLNGTNTLSGATISGSQLVLSPALVVSGSATTGSWTGLFESKTFTGSNNSSGGTTFNLLQITDNVADNTPGAISVGLQLNHFVGGASAAQTGGALGADFVVNVNGAVNPANPAQFTGLQGQGKASVNVGGTGLTDGTSGGSLFGNNFTARLFSGATNWTGLTVAEFDIEADTGSSVQDKTGFHVTQQVADVVAGYRDDVSIGSNSQSGATVGWNVVYGVGRQAAYPPTNSSTTIFKLIGHEGLNFGAIANGIDFSQADFTGFTWNDGNTSISGSGVLQIGRGYISDNGTGLLFNSAGSIGTGGVVASPGSGYLLSSTERVEDAYNGVWIVTTDGTGAVSGISMTTPPRTSSASPPNPVNLNSESGQPGSGAQVTVTWSTGTTTTVGAVGQSVALKGTVTSPTATIGTNNTTVATMAALAAAVPSVTTNVPLVGNGTAGEAVAASGIMVLPGASNYAAFEASGSNMGVALQPTGTGALVAAVPDSTTTGGNARGTNAVDWQGPSQRTAAGQVASGTNAFICGGANNTASGNNTTVCGTTNTASGNYTEVFGGNNNASGANSNVSGRYATDRGDIGRWVYSSDDIAALGDSQIHMETLQATSSSTGVTRLTADGNAAGTTNTVNIPNNTAYNCQIDLVGKNKTTTGNAASVYGITGLLDRGANAAATVYTAGAAGTVVSHGTGLASTATLAADTTNGGLSISVTPPNNNTWDWTARVMCVETQ